jgi:hypothetical protein
MDPRNFARDLAEGLQAVVPDGFLVTFDQDASEQGDGQRRLALIKEERAKLPEGIGSILRKRESSEPESSGRSIGLRADLTFEHQAFSMRSGIQFRVIYEVAEADFSGDSLGSPDDRAALKASIVALEGLQEYVAELSTDPWPNRGSGHMPEAHGAIENGAVVLWFGSREAPILLLDPIQLRPS